MSSEPDQVDEHEHTPAAMGEWECTTRFEDVPELRELPQDELYQLHVHDAVIQEIRGDTGEGGWMATIILAVSDDEVLTWKFGRRPTRDEAQRTVVWFLRGILEMRRATIAAIPPVSDRDYSDAYYEAYRATDPLDLWRERHAHPEWDDVAKDESTAEA